MNILTEHVVLLPFSVFRLPTIRKVCAKSYKKIYLFIFVCFLYEKFIS